MARPTKLTRAVIKKANDYIENYAGYGHVIPSVVGMAVILNVSKSTVYKWGQDEGLKFSDILAKCNTRQETVLINGGLKGELNSNITKLVLGKHGYHETMKNENSGPNGGPQEHKWTVEFVDATPSSK